MKADIVYADKKSEKILSRNFWKHPEELSFPLSAPSDRRVFPINLKDTLSNKNDYFIAVKQHRNADKLKYEFNKLKKARELGISVVKPLAIKFNEKGGGYLYTLIDKGNIPLSSIDFKTLKRDERVKLFRLLGQTVRKWHEKNFYHGDLAPRNILMKVQPKPRFVALDLEKALIQELSEVNIRKDLSLFAYNAKRHGASEEDIKNFYYGYESKGKKQFELF